jgi:hypothetical protein
MMKMSKTNQESLENTAESSKYDIIPLKPHQCPKCGRRFNTHNGMAEHRGMAHGIEPLHRVNLCIPVVLDEWINLQVNAGVYVNISECVRACINHVRLVTLEGER